MRSVLLVLFSICSLTASAQIKIDAEKNVDMRKFTTFRVEQGQIIYQANDKKKDEKKIFAILKNAITQELTLRGYQPVSDSLAELSVSYVYEERGSAVGDNQGPLGQAPIDDPTSVDVNERSATISTGILILEIERIKDKNSLWTATCTISRIQTDFAKTIEATVIAAFKKFPSKNKK